MAAVCRALLVMTALVTAVAATGLTGHASGAGGTAPGRVWDDPVLVDGDGQAARETSLALNPVNPDQLFVCDPSGVPNTPNGQSYFHLSDDGGQTWRFVDVEGGTDDTRNYAFEGGDCDVAFDEAGTMYTADTWLGNLSVGHSRDGGKTWAGTALATTTPVVDRPWIVGGEAGTLYLTYQDLQCCTTSAMFFTKSTDYGMTWDPAVPITTAGTSGAFTWEGNFVVSDDGQTLHLIYTRRSSLPASDIDGSYSEQVTVATSRDAGFTWTSTVITTTDRPASYLYPSLAQSDDGVLHAVYASRRDDADDRPVFYSASADDGRTWTEPIPLTEGTSGVAPWVVTHEGDALVHWLGSPHAQADTSTESPWFFYWARVRGGSTDAPVVTAGTTTDDPMFVGRQTMPEFNQLRVDDDGMVHIGASIFGERADGRTGWLIYYQRERLEDVSTG